MGLVDQKNLNFNRYISPSKKAYYISRGMNFKENLNREGISMQIKKARASKVDQYIVSGWMATKKENDPRNLVLFYGDASEAIKSNAVFTSTVLELAIMDYFFTVTENSDRAIAEAFNLPRQKISNIIQRHLDEKYRLVNMRINGIEPKKSDSLFVEKFYSKINSEIKSSSPSEALPKFSSAFFFSLIK